MRRWEALGSLWPGLPQLWRHGSVSALLLALGFAVLLNSVLLTSYAQPDLAPPWLRSVLWWVLVLGWGVSQRRWLGRAEQPDEAVAPADDQGLFLQAQAEYLRGHWYEAESVLRTLLSSTPQDVDARLLLVSLLRRSGRAAEARHELSQLAAAAGASKWSLEIERERALLESLRKADDDRPDKSPDDQVQLNDDRLDDGSAAMAA